MKQTISTAIMLCCILSAGFIIKPESTGSKTALKDHEPPCRFEGVYILEPAGGAATYGLDMAIPLDASNDHVALNHDLANYDVTFGGLFPSAVRLTTGQGEAIRTGPRTFDYTIHFWALNANNQRVILIVSNGTKVLNETDCRSYVTTGGMLSVFTPDQDADKDGYPDKGQSPKFCVPVTFKAKRVSVIPPCKP